MKIYFVDFVFHVLIHGIDLLHHFHMLVSCPTQIKVCAMLLVVRDLLSIIHQKFHKTVVDIWGRG